METIARGDVPKTLQTIAYISIPDSADLEFCFGTSRMPSRPMHSFLAPRSPARSIWKRMMPVQSMASC